MDSPTFFNLGGDSGRTTMLQLYRAFSVCALVVAVIFAPLSKNTATAQSAKMTRITVTNPPVDLSFLNEKPAGLRGTVRAKGANLVFQDGTPVRFWGANIQAYAIFSTAPGEVCRQAKRLAALGFNLVRLHHHDSHWVNPNVFGHDSTNTLSLAPEQLDQIGLWVSCLKSEGIYTWIDLHVGRRMGAADHFPFAEEVERKDGDIRGFNFVNDGILERMAEFQAAYLSHVNPHTGVAFKDDPAVAAVMVSNENDAVRHFGNRLLPDKDAPQHSNMYMALAKDFARKNGLDPRQTWKSWEHGDSKLFLNDLEKRFYAPLVGELREIGFGGLVATSSIWGGMSASGLPSLTLGDLIDVHSYGKSGIAFTDPVSNSDMISVIAGMQVAGKPLSISEWNISPWPEPDRFLAPLRMGAAAAHQGWDAPIIYGYAQNALGNGSVAHNWHVAEDASLLGPLAVAALLYRRGDVAEAASVVAIAPEAGRLMGKRLHADTSFVIRSMAERSRVVNLLPEIPELAWFSPPTEEVDKIVDELDATSNVGASRLVRSDTGEIYRDPDAGVIWIETARSLVIAGNLSGKSYEVGGLRVALDRTLAGVALQSIDGSPIEKSRDLIVTIMGPSEPAEGNHSPFLIERATGEIAFRARPELLANGVSIGNDHGQVAHHSDGGFHTLIFDQAPSISWVRLTAR